MKWSISLAFCGLFACGVQVYAAETSVEKPRSTPVTRPEMKRFIEDMKERTARIPLPEPTGEDAKNPDPRSRGYEGRLRSLYLPNTDARAYLPFAGSPPARPGSEAPRWGSEPDPKVTLDYGFKTRLFWIAARANNCQYCLGHQESKLLAVGMTDDDLANLDSDWSAFPEKERAAFALARRLTLQPDQLTDADIDACRPHFTDLQILEMALSVGGNNAINRWKEGTGVPQSTSSFNFGGKSGGDHSSYLTPTSEKFLKAPSIVVNTSKDFGGKISVDTLLTRTGLDIAAVNKGLQTAATRKARLPVASEEEARTVLAENATKENLLKGLPEGKAIPGWMRLLAQFPIAGTRSVASFQANERNIGLDPLLMARMDFEIARQDAAWYALGTAKSQLKHLGQNEEQIAALIRGQGDLSKKDQALLTVAKNLAASPVVLTDNEVKAAVDLAGPGDVVKTIHYASMRALFDRFTEAAGLPLDE
jgi:alkylhydroperoxidase family enzyme